MNKDWTIFRTGDSKKASSWNQLKWALIQHNDSFCVLLHLLTESCACDLQFASKQKNHESNKSKKKKRPISDSVCTLSSVDKLLISGLTKHPCCFVDPSFSLTQDVGSLHIKFIHYELSQ